MTSSTKSHSQRLRDLDRYRLEVKLTEFNIKYPPDLLLRSCSSCLYAESTISIEDTPKVEIKEAIDDGIDKTGTNIVYVDGSSSELDNSAEIVLKGQEGQVSEVAF